MQSLAGRALQGRNLKEVWVALREPFRFCLLLVAQVWKNLLDLASTFGLGSSYRADSYVAFNGEYTRTYGNPPLGEAEDSNPAKLMVVYDFQNSLRFSE
jgi:hypothetical protein